MQNSFDIDLGDVSELDYYTGLIFKVFIQGAGARVGRGGRYDRLIGNFGANEPAIGFILDLDALTDVLARGGTPVVSDSVNEVSEIAAGELSATFLQARAARAAGKRVQLQL